MSLILFNSRRQFVAPMHESFVFSDYAYKQQFLARNPTNTLVISDQAIIHRLYSKNISEPTFYADTIFSQQIYFYQIADTTSVSVSAHSMQIHVRKPIDRYQSIDQVSDYSIHILDMVENELTIDAGTTTQIITGLGVTEQINVSDSLYQLFGKPVPIVPLPGTDVNTPYEVPSPFTFPKIPINGYSIGFNVALGSISLVTNSINNSTFAAGLYIFYNKNNSVWYRFKNTPSNNNFGEIWSEEYLLYSGAGNVINATNFTGDVGVRDSTTIFDSNGFPITAFVNADGYIGVQYFVNSMPILLNTQIIGTSLNLVLIEGSIILMWIPKNYTDSLYFSDSNAAFQASCQYYVGVPGNLQSFSLTQKDNFDWTFSFTTIINDSPYVYYAST